MADTLPTSLTLDIVTPDRQLVHEQVDEGELPGADGYFGVLPGHTPLLAALHVGELWYRKGLDKHYLAVASGFKLPAPNEVRYLTADPASDARLAAQALQGGDVVAAGEPAVPAEAAGDIKPVANVSSPGDPG